MSSKTRKEYLEILSNRYVKESKKERTEILNEAVRNCGLHRKYLISVLNKEKHSTARGEPPRAAGRPVKYGHPQLKEILIAIWKASNLICSKRLSALIPLWLPWYSQTFRTAIDPEVEQLLRTISPSTIDRLLARSRRIFSKHGLATTKPGALLKTHIPIKTEQWDETRPGYLEADTVAHCGSSVSGMFALTLNTVDIATGWTEQRAVWGKGKEGVRKQIANIEDSLPFPLLGFDADNGGEFINWHLFEYFSNRKPRVDYTRSREYKKNDNSHVEEKNWTKVRQYLGYDRFDHPGVVAAMNDLYKTEWRLLHNFFIPSFKLLSKERRGSRVIKKHSAAMTPYERVMASPIVAKKKKAELKILMSSLNPFLLEKEINRKIKLILSIARCNDKSCPLHD